MMHPLVIDGQRYESSTAPADEIEIEEQIER